MKFMTTIHLESRNKSDNRHIPLASLAKKFAQITSNILDCKILLERWV